MRRSHHASIIDGHVGKQPVEVHILLGVCVDQVMIMMPRNGKNRLAIELRIIKTVQQVNPARAGCGQANPSLPLYLA